MALLQNCKFKFKKNYVVLKCKKMFLFEKIDGNVLIFFFSEIPKIFICVRVRDGAFYLRTENVIRMKQCPLFLL